MSLALQLFRVLGVWGARPQDNAQITRFRGGVSGLCLGSSFQGTRVANTHLDLKPRP